MKINNMNFSDEQLQMIRVASQLRREAAMENDEVVEQRKWEAIIVKFNLITKIV